ncbi:hypothetical protein LG3211_3816 [Lysobacter gummosus]|nr:hypothetical protein LG3211_3816 [Lysobacter gummosus]
MLEAHWETLHVPVRWVATRGGVLGIHAADEFEALTSTTGRANAALS